jgi:hypothetical protein
LGGDVGTIGFAVGCRDGGRDVVLGDVTVLHAREITITILAIYQRGLNLAFMGPPWMFYYSIEGSCTEFKA